MGRGPVTSDTSPPEGEAVNRRLEAGGPLGFIMAVHASLERFDRPYFYTAGVPDWLLARESDAEEEEGPSGFEQDYRRFEEGERPKRSIKEVPHCA